jgi:hypothetical protein
MIINKKITELTQHLDVPSYCKFKLLKSIFKIILL